MNCLLALILVVAFDPPPEIADGIRESQLTLILDRGGKKTQLQGTVIARDDLSLTIFTAAHGVGPNDVKSDLHIRKGQKITKGKIEGAVRNPYFRPPPSTDIPGADNVIVRIRLEEEGGIDLDSIRLAELAPWAIPDPDGQNVTIQTIDQFGNGHLVKGGNYSNPRWLEWGPTYRPVPGDSGSGVFVLRKKNDGTMVPILVGAVVDRSERGGGASLVHLRDKWLFEATRPAIKPGG